MTTTKRLFMPLLIAALTMVASPLYAQKKAEDKSKRPSPPAVASQVIAGGAKITINYGQPSVKGRVIGKDIEPMDGQIWRAGANEATVFTSDKPLTIEGRPLPAGKYAFFTIRNGEVWTLIFNKTWDTWGAYDYDKNKGNDALQITVNEAKANPFAEKLTYTIGKSGKVTMMWGDKMVSFNAATKK